jgi:hypothetical protein
MNGAFIGGVVDRAETTKTGVAVCMRAGRVIRFPPSTSSPTRLPNGRSTNPAAQPAIKVSQRRH